MAVIEVDKLTKDYGEGRGVFDVSFAIEQSECFGFLGPNGAGKTTTIRHLLGFSRPDSGSTRLFGCNCWPDAAPMMGSVGYLPGEVALPGGMTAQSFLAYQQRLRGMSSPGRTNELVSRFELDTHEHIRAMSLGERRKLAVVCAFMHDPDVLILDEPTSGLDPIMQDVFIAFILEEKQRGKTILLSSHIFNEVAACCDRIAIIKQGRIALRLEAEDLGRYATAPGATSSPGSPEPAAAARDDTATATTYQGSLLSAVLKHPLHDYQETSLLMGEPDTTAAISMRGITKDYGNGQGIFDISLDVHPGECFGFVGTSGSGKTTTIRTLMGFVRPQAGRALVCGRDAWQDSASLKSRMGYIPGEMRFPSFHSANAFFDYQAKLLGLSSTAGRDALAQALRLDTSVNPRKMSKGMKQKTAIIAALMADDDVLLLDEPTTGLDPVMRDVFIHLMAEQKARGKTIFMSSHIFEEIEEICDRVAIIDHGHIVDILTTAELESYRTGTQDERRLALEARFKAVFAAGPGDSPAPQPLQEGRKQ